MNAPARNSLPDTIRKMINGGAQPSRAVAPQKGGARRALDNGDGSLAGVADMYVFNVTGTVPGGGNTIDQLNLFNFPTDLLQSGAVLCPSALQATSTGYTNVQLAQHFLTHPAPLVNWNIPASTNQQVLSSMVYYTVRRAASGKLQQDDIPVAGLLTSMQYQSDRVQFTASGAIIYDGETFARFVWTQQNPVVTLTVAMNFGPAVDLRKMAQTANPVTIAGG